MKEITIQIPDGKKAEWVNGVLTLVDEPQVDNRPVTERIKTFEDACKALGEHHPFVVSYTNMLSVATREDFMIDGWGADMVAYAKLRIIAAALNEGWEPKFTTTEYRYYPWFYLYAQNEVDEMSEEERKEKQVWLFGGGSYDGSAGGLASAGSGSGWSASYASVSARLAVKSKDLAIYFGRQFVEIWADYVVCGGGLEARAINGKGN